MELLLQLMVQCVSQFVVGLGAGDMNAFSVPSAQKYIAVSYNLIIHHYYLHASHAGKAGVVS